MRCSNDKESVYFEVVKIGLNLKYFCFHSFLYFSCNLFVHCTFPSVLKFILENSEVKIQFYGTEVIGVTVPTTVELVVTDTQPSIKGATVTGSGKPATLETGLVVNVPDFIEVGQKLIINTAEGTYVSRA